MCETADSGIGIVRRSRLFCDSLHDRHRLRLRGGARLNHRALIGVAVGDDAGKGRGDARVVKQRLRLALMRLRDGELLLGGGEGRLGGGDLRFRHPVAARRIVDVLLRDQIGLRLDHAVEAGRRQVRELVRRLRRDRDRPGRG